MFYFRRAKFQIISSAIILTVLASAGIAEANTSDKEAIYKAGLNYIEGFYEGDSSKLKESLKPSLKKFGFWKDKETGEFSKPSWMTFEKAIAYADNVKAKKEFAKADAPKKVEVIDHTTKIAAVKISAWWGVDYMLLSKTDGVWMIEEVIWEGPSLEANPTDSDKYAVKRAALNYVEGFYEGDASKLKASLNPKLFKFGFGYDKKKGQFRKGGQMTFEKAIAYTKWVQDNDKFAGPDAPKKVEVLGVMNKIALTKVTATWGVDYMLLSKTGDKWMIDQVLWAGLPPKPKA